jgi:glutaconate CoA-transferase, subunit B
MKPAAETNEFEVVSLHPGISRERVRENTGWDVKFSDHLSDTAPPVSTELDALKDLHARTARAHATSKGGSHAPTS